MRTPRPTEAPLPRTQSPQFPGLLGCNAFSNHHVTCCCLPTLQGYGLDMSLKGLATNLGIAGSRNFKSEAWLGVVTHLKSQQLRG